MTRKRIQELNPIIGEFLLELRKNFNVSAKATCFVSEKIFHLLSTGRKQHTQMFHRAYTNSYNVRLDDVPKVILFLKSLFQMACKNLAPRKPFLRLLNRRKVLLNL